MYLNTQKIFHLQKKAFNFTVTWGRLSECGCVQEGEKCQLAVCSCLSAITRAVCVFVLDASLNSQ